MTYGGCRQDDPLNPARVSPWRHIDETTEETEITEKIISAFPVLFVVSVLSFGKSL